jgi:hypothetical protein
MKSSIPNAPLTGRSATLLSHWRVERGVEGVRRATSSKRQYDYFLRSDFDLRLRSLS